MKPIFSILQGIRKKYMEKDSLMPKKKRTFQPIETLWTSFYVHQIKRVDSLIVHQKSKRLQSLEGSPKYWTDLQSTYTYTCNSDIIKGNQKIWSRIAWCPFKVSSTRVNGFQINDYLSFRYLPKWISNGKKTLLHYVEGHHNKFLYVPTFP